METNSFFQELLNKYDLGDLLDTPVLLPGGLLHESYKLSTTSGNYAVKLINPSVLKEEYALKEFEKESQMEDMLAKAGVNAVYPISYDGSKMLEVNGRYFYLASWFDGMPLKIDEVTEYHCKAVAEQLARIHNIEIKETERPTTDLYINFERYATLCKEASLSFADLFSENLELLNNVLSRSAMATNKVPSTLAFCHNDYDLKNVLWNKEQFRIIDLEAVSFNNPYREIMSSALSWSGADDLRFDEKLFDVYLKSYFDNSKLDLKINWDDVYDAETSRLTWLEFNLERSLKEDISKEEKEAAISQVNKTINRIIYFDEIREKVLNNQMLK